MFADNLPLPLVLINLLGVAGIVVWHLKGRNRPTRASTANAAKTAFRSHCRRRHISMPRLPRQPPDSVQPARSSTQPNVRFMRSAGISFDRVSIRSDKRTLRSFSRQASSASHMMRATAHGVLSQ